MKTNEEIVDEILKSDPFRRVSGAEDLLMKTGRMGEYYGKTMQEILTEALEAKDAEREKAVEEEREKCIETIKQIRPRVEGNYKLVAFDEIIKALTPTISSDKT